MRLQTCLALIICIFCCYSIAQPQYYRRRYRECKDEVSCAWYVRLGYCRSRLAIHRSIARLCRKSCGLCTEVKKPQVSGCRDRHYSCRSWASFGYCFSNRRYMNQMCRQSCGFCGAPGCYDLNRNCGYWARRRQCRINPKYMLQYCKKSCKVCGTKPKPKPKPRPKPKTRPRPTQPPKTTVKSVQPPLPTKKTTLPSKQPPIPVEPSTTKKPVEPPVPSKQPPIPVEPSTTTKPVEPPFPSKQPPIPVEPSTTKKPVEPPTPSKQPPIPVEPSTTKKPVEPPTPSEQPPIPVEPSTTKKPVEPPIPVEPSTTKKPVEPPIPVEPSTTKKPVEPPSPPIPPIPIKPVSTEEPSTSTSPQTKKPSKTDPPPIPVIPRENVTLATLPPETSSLNSDKCGLPSVNHIVGGNVSKPGEWPWMVALAEKTNPTKAICGASLLTDRWIMTAAHCFRTGKTAQDYIVRVGEFDLKKNGEEVVMNVDKLIKHERYNIPTKDYDIALLHLEKRVKFTRTIKPVCMASNNANYPDGKKCMVAGWGYRHEWLLGGPDKLHAVEVPIVNYDKCKENVENFGHLLSDRMICAGLIEGGKDSCKGDSGGPLMCRPDDGGAWQQVGIVSWGVGCARPNRYGVYTEISKVYAWIEDKVNPFVGVLP